MQFCDSPPFTAVQIHAQLNILVVLGGAHWIAKEQSCVERPWSVKCTWWCWFWSTGPVLEALQWAWSVVVILHQSWNRFSILFMLWRSRTMKISMDYCAASQFYGLGLPEDDLLLIQLCRSLSHFYCVEQLDQWVLDYEFGHFLYQNGRCLI